MLPSSERPVNVSRGLPTNQLNHSIFHRMKCIRLYPNIGGVYLTSKVVITNIMKKDTADWIERKFGRIKNILRQMNSRMGFFFKIVIYTHTATKRKS